MKRKIIQIAAVPDMLFALCDDGTLWRINRRIEGDWIQIPMMDQPRPAPPAGYEEFRNSGGYQ